MFVKKVALRNIRGFRNIEIDLLDASAPNALWTMLVGTNGTGKSTILRALALALANESDAHAMLASRFGNLLPSDVSIGSITVYYSDHLEQGPVHARQTVIQSDSKGQERLQQGGSTKLADDDGTDVALLEYDEPFLVGYGVSRMRFGDSSKRPGRIFETARTLFDYDATLTPVELTLRRMEDFLGSESYSSAMDGIRRALNLPEGTTIKSGHGGGVVVETPGSNDPIPLDGWADGFRLNLSWIIDFYGVALAADRLSPSGGIRGILLIDEIEQHTHPSLQESLIANLKQLWPELQVVATTHSPLVVLGAEPGEVVALKRSEKGEVVQAPQPGSFDGYSAEDILNDERLFDTRSQRERDAELQTAYERLAAVPAKQRTEEQSAKLAKLGQELLERSRSATDPEEARDGTVASAAAPFPASGGVARSDPAEIVKDLKALRERYGL